MIEWILLGAAALVILFLIKLVMDYKSLYWDAISKKTSILVKHGKTMEHLIPWMKDFPGDPRKFRFIGDPIDGLLFSDDGITFMEFKSGKSGLSGIQRKIKSLVKEKRVLWKEILVD